MDTKTSFSKKEKSMASGHLQPRDPGAQRRVALGAEGSIVAILGGKRRGQTTTLRAISSLLKASGGSDQRQHSAARRAQRHTHPG